MTHLNEPDESLEPPHSEEEILEDLDYGSLEQDVFLLHSYLLTTD